jgi:tetratricopeptide (TPR) repeat protein
MKTEQGANMRTLKFFTLFLTGALLLTLVAFGLKSAFTCRLPAIDRSAETITRDPEPGKANQRIAVAQRTIEQSPQKAAGYNQLAAAYMQKARETSDFEFNAKAEGALARAFELEPDNYDTIKLHAKLQLTYHRFSEALKTAERAMAVRTDDHDVWGQITDAHVELGDYPEAVKAAQKMINLRPDSSSYARVSYLRSLHGDTYGAIQAMNVALKAANPNDPEGVAWCRVHLGDELMNAGKLSEAEQEFDKALQTFPGYHLALEAKGRARIAAGDLQGAVTIYEREQAANASADGSLILGDLYSHLGQTEAAKRKYETFESLERENAATESSWRHMVNYWLDRDQQLEQSLSLAQREYESRKDIFTCDTLAWALFKNGRLAEAEQVIKQALRLRTRDARINYHAGLIYRSLNRRAEAAKHLKLACAMNASFDLKQVETAKRLLDELN